MNRRRLIRIAWATVLLYVLLAVCMTHIPKPPAELEKFTDKTLHKGGYFLYAATIYVAASVTWPKRRGLSLFVVLALALWAAADEITQPYFGRTCDFLDWRSDMIGAIAAVVVLSVLRFIVGRFDRRRLPLVLSPRLPGER